MRHDDRRVRSLHGVAVLVVLAACSPEAITSGALDQSPLPVASVERADTGSIAREKWLLRLAGQEAAIAGPDRWFSLEPGNVHAIGASRALLTSPHGSSAILTDGGDAAPNVLRGATSVSIAASNIFVLTMFTKQVYSLEGDGMYEVYYNGKAGGGASYSTWAYYAALVSQSVNMSISASETDTIDVNARTRHKVRHEPYVTMEDSFYLNVVSFGHDRYAPALTPPAPIDYQSPTGGGPDGAPDGEIGCWFHYRSYDGGHTWYLLRVSCPEAGGKYRGLAPTGALHSVTATDAHRSGSSTSGTSTSDTQPARPATFVVLGQDRLEDGQRAVVYLRPGMNPEAVIAVDRKNARPSDIAEGVAAMMTLRSDAGSREQGGFYRTVVMQTAKIPRVLAESGQKRFGGYLSAMKHAPLVNVPGVGSGYAVEVQMPTGH
jgi:hypothetical protein